MDRPGIGALGSGVGCLLEQRRAQPYRGWGLDTLQEEQYSVNVSRDFKHAVGVLRHRNGLGLPEAEGYKFVKPVSEEELLGFRRI